MSKRISVLIIALALCAIALIPAAAGASQQLAVTAGKASKSAVTVKVAATKGALVRVSGTGLARTRTIRFSKAGIRSVRLPLSAKGRKAQRGCKSVDVKAVDTRSGRRAAGRSQRCGAEPATPQDNLLATQPGCDPLDPSACLLPYPNDYFTKAADTATGRQVDMLPTSMPRNVAGKPIVPTDWNRADGFSPGSPILVKVPGLDSPAALKASGVVPQTDMAQSFDGKQSVLLLDADTKNLDRALIWAEVDMHADISQSERNLIIRPGKNLVEGHRYIVVLRNLKDATGKPLTAPRAFQLYRDNLITNNPLIEDRRPHMESLFKELEKARPKVDRDELYLAWDFTVASTDDRVGRMLDIRDQAFAELGDTTMDDLIVQGSKPTYTIDTVTDGGAGQRKVEGTITVPCFMDKPKCPPAANSFLFGPDGEVTRIPGNTMDVYFTCNISKKATAASPSRVSLYGHGLLGSAEGEGNGGSPMNFGNDQNVTQCATDWAGMAFTDVPTVATILTDLSNFPHLADRVQQGILNFMFLGRAMIHPDGFVKEAAFRVGKAATGAPLIDPAHLYYDGNSQGGIIGMALMGVTPDAERGVLGVPGMNYSTLLQRSSDFENRPGKPCPAPPATALAGLQAAITEGIEEQEFDPEAALGIVNFSYACPLYASYPQKNERQLLFALIQQLWDRAEGNGYAAHIREGIPGRTPPHEVLLHGALGDHQVAQVAAETAARTIGAAIRQTPFDVDRTFYEGSFPFGIQPASFPHSGSLIEIWDSGSAGSTAPGCAGPGTEVAPIENLPPYCGKDPHGEPRSTPYGFDQRGAFLQPGGKAIDACFGGPCYSRGNPKYAAYPPRPAS